MAAIQPQSKMTTRKARCDRSVRREIETAHLAGQRRDALSDEASTNKKNLDEGEVKMFRMFPPDMGKY